MPPLNLQEEINKVTRQGAVGDQPFRAGGQSTMMGPQEPAPTPAPAPAPTVGTIMGTAAAPTRAQELERIRQEALGIQAKVNALTDVGEVQKAGLQIPTLETGDDKFIDPTLVDEEAIRRKQMRLFQKEIDATNEIYNQMLDEARFEGEGRLGSQRAISARSGVLGSDYGAAQKETVVGYNRRINQGIQAERAAKIASIMGEMRKAVVDEVAAKRKAQQESADALIAFNASKAERRKNNLNTLAGALITQGIDPNELSEEELADLAKSGITKADLFNTYQTLKAEKDAEAAAADLETRKTESEIAKNQRIELSEGQTLLDADGNVIYRAPKTYAPGTGAAAIPSTVSTDIRNRLESNRGSDNYTDTGKYIAEYERFVAAGGTPEQFLKAFDPDIYINPNDPTRGWLASQMNKAATVDPIDALVADALSQALNPPQ